MTAAEAEELGRRRQHAFAEQQRAEEMMRKLAREAAAKVGRAVADATKRAMRNAAERAMGRLADRIKGLADAISGGDKKKR